MGAKWGQTPLDEGGWERTLTDIVALGRCSPPCTGSSGGTCTSAGATSSRSPTPCSPRPSRKAMLTRVGTWLRNRRALRSAPAPGGTQASGPEVRGASTARPGRAALRAGQPLRPGHRRTPRWRVRRHRPTSQRRPARLRAHLPGPATAAETSARARTPAATPAAIGPRVRRRPHRAGPGRSPRSCSVRTGRTSPASPPAHQQHAAVGLANAGGRGRGEARADGGEVPGWPCRHPCIHSENSRTRTRLSQG